MSNRKSRHIDPAEEQVSHPTLASDNPIDRRQFVATATGLFAVTNLGGCGGDGTGPGEGTLDLTITGLDPSATSGGTAVATPVVGGTPVSIVIPPVGHQTAQVPEGSYTVAYTPPSNHSLAAGQASTLNVTISTGTTTPITIALFATGTMQVNVTGLTGSPANGGSASAQRTDASGSPITINVSAAGTGSAVVPTGTYTVTYTPPSGFTVASGVTNPATGRGVTIGATNVTTFAVQQAVATGTISVSVTGLTGSPSNGGSVSAQRTDAAGAPVTINVSAAGSGSGSVPAGTYSVTYTPPSGFNVTTANPITGLVVAGGATVAANYTVQAVSTAGLVFRSDWSTALGTSDAALRDTGKPLPWDLRVGNGTLNEVIAATGLGFPAGMANVIKTSLAWNGNGAATQFVRVTNDIPVPNVGQSIFYRWYIRVEQSSAYTVDTNTHPIQDGNAAGDVNWLYRIEILPNDTFIGRFQCANANAAPNNFWSPGALPKGQVFRYELQVLRNAATTFQMHAKVFNSSNEQILGDIDFKNQNLSSSLANNPSLNIHVLANFAGLNGGGHNGVFGPGQQELFPMVHSYQGGFCVRTDDFCGPYANGI